LKHLSIIFFDFQIVFGVIDDELDGKKSNMLNNLSEINYVIIGADGFEALMSLSVQLIVLRVMFL
jgi:hypothetical protein